MANLVINLNNVDETKTGGFEALPAGIYAAIIEEVELTDSKKGSPMLKWTFKLTNKEYKNRKMFNYTLLDKDFGVAMLKKTIMCSEAQVDFDSFDIEQFVKDGEAVGLPIGLKLGIQNYNGEKRNNVKDVLPVEEVEEDDDFDSNFGY